MAKFTRNSKKSGLKKSFLFKIKYSRDQKSQKNAEKSTCPVRVATSALKRTFFCPGSRATELPPSQEFLCPGPQDLVRVTNTSCWPVVMASRPQSNHFSYPGFQDLSIYQMGGQCLQPFTESASTHKPKSRTGRVRIHENQSVVINNYF